MNIFMYICFHVTIPTRLSSVWGKEPKKLQSPATCWKHHLRLQQASDQKKWGSWTMNQQKRKKLNNKNSGISLCAGQCVITQTGYRPVTRSESIMIFFWAREGKTPFREGKTPNPFFFSPDFALHPSKPCLDTYPAILGLQSSCHSASDHQAGYRAPNRKVPSKHCQSGLLDGFCHYLSQ